LNSIKKKEGRMLRSSNGRPSELILARSGARDGNPRGPRPKHGFSSADTARDSIKHQIRLFSPINAVQTVPEIADQPTGACVNHDRVRLGQALRAGGEGMLFMEAEG
jgi:hypothetical protein